MAGISRPLDAATLAKTSAIFTRPVRLVELDFPSGTRYYSTGEEIVWGGHTYVPHLIDVGEFSFDGDAEQSGQIELLNPDNVASSLVLADGISDVAVRVYDAYSTGFGTITPPTPMVSGVCMDSDITPTSVLVTVVTTSSRTEYHPNQYVSKAMGFNWLPAEGSKVVWGDETYVFERGF